MMAPRLLRSARRGYGWSNGINMSEVDDMRLIPH
jgi:hypothetical protein